MARSLLILALALLAAAAVVSDDQLDEINDHLAKCVRQVPRPSDFVDPGATCRFEAIFALSDGASVEDVPSIVVECLKERSVKSVVVAAVQQCIQKALA